MPFYQTKLTITFFSMVASIWVSTFQAYAKEIKAGGHLERVQIEKRIQELQPTAKERRFDAIGWVAGIRTAEQWARETGRPVFLFSNVGQMGTGRC